MYMKVMKIMSCDTNNRGNGFIRDENPDEVWEITPLDPDDNPEEMDIFECDEDDDSSFYTEEDYENCPVLRVLMRKLGGEDPLGRDYADLDGE